MKSGHPTRDERMDPRYLDQAGSGPDSKETVTLDAVDPTTGAKVGKLKAEIDKPKYDFKGRRYKSVGILMESVLYDKPLPPLDVRIALWIPSICDRDTNKVVLSYRAVRKKFPTVDKSSLSKALKRLAAMELLDRDEEPSHYTISPDYSWMGSAKDHRIAVAKWRERMAAKWRRENGFDPIVELPVDEARTA